jgi:hypothetical protein
MWYLTLLWSSLEPKTWTLLLTHKHENKNRERHKEANRQTQNIQGLYSSVILQNMLMFCRFVFRIELKEVKL